MSKFHCFSKKLQHLCSGSCIKLACFGKSFGCLLSSLYQYLIFQVNSFWLQLCYFMSISFMGFFILRSLKTRTIDPFDKPSTLDVFFTSVSATTVSSMSTVEMEVFSNTQLVVLTILMLLGAEVFTSMVGLYLVKSKYKVQDKLETNKVDSLALAELNFSDQLELGIFATNKSNPFLNENEAMSIEHLKYNSMRYLGYVVLGYLVAILAIGSTLVSLYMVFVPSAYEVLRNKGLHLQTFSAFVIVSTFANCGYVPTSENMVIFRKNSGLLLMLIPQVLFGNTLFPACLRSVIWVLKKITNRDEFKFLLKNTKEVDYIHLLPSKQSLLLVATNFGFIAVQFILYCAMEWNSEGLDGMNVYQKIVGILFQAVNSRHAGENIADLSTVSPAILVLYVVMMLLGCLGWWLQIIFESKTVLEYKKQFLWRQIQLRVVPSPIPCCVFVNRYLPPYTSFVPTNSHEKSLGSCEKKKTKRGKLIENILFSQLSYLVMFIILICITERNKIKNDPLNFTLLNITIEVISAYGNVGFTTGYSCKRQLNPDGHCKDMMYGFVGRWSNKGKLILIVVMFFGRLKKFNLNGGRAWMLL